MPFSVIWKCDVGWFGKWLAELPLTRLPRIMLSSAECWSRSTITRDVTAWNRSSPKSGSGLAGANSRAPGCMSSPDFMWCINSRFPVFMQLMRTKQMLCRAAILWNRRTICAIYLRLSLNAWSPPLRCSQNVSITMSFKFGRAITTCSSLSLSKCW